MQAAVMTAPGRIEIQRVRRPTPAPGQVLIRIEGCGVCASNLGPWSGPDWMRFPTAPGAFGHEAWGIVEALGERTGGVTIGDRVAGLTYNSYAEYDVADVSAIVRLPRSVEGQPFPGEPLACAMNVFRRSGIEAGQTVAIVGIGFLGALLTRLTSAAGAQVIAISRRPFALAVARKMGAAATVEAAGRGQVRDAVEALNGGLCERAIEAAGHQAALDLASELVRERGRLIIAGYHQDGQRVVNMQSWNWRGLDVVNAHERDPAVYMQGMREAVEAVTCGHLDPTPLYTHRFPLERLGAALDATRDRPEGFLKALVSPG